VKIKDQLAGNKSENMISAKYKGMYFDWILVAKMAGNFFLDTTVVANTLNVCKV
jgi:hypothetical protein